MDIHSHVPQQRPQFPTKTCFKQHVDKLIVSKCSEKPERKDLKLNDKTQPYSTCNRSRTFITMMEINTKGVFQYRKTCEVMRTTDKSGTT